MNLPNINPNGENVRERERDREKKNRKENNHKRRANGPKEEAIKWCTNYGENERKQRNDDSKTNTQYKWCRRFVLWNWKRAWHTRLTLFWLRCSVLHFFFFFFCSSFSVCLCYQNIVHYFIWRFGDETKWRLNERRLPVTLHAGRGKKQTIEMTIISLQTPSPTAKVICHNEEREKNRPFIFTLVLSFSHFTYFFLFLCFLQGKEFHSNWKWIGRSVPKAIESTYVPFLFTGNLRGHRILSQPLKSLRTPS